LTGGSVTYIAACALLQWANIAAGCIVVWLAGALHTLTVLLTQVLIADSTDGRAQVFCRVCAVKPVQVLFTLAFTSLAKRCLFATQPTRLQARALTRKRNRVIIAFDLTVEVRDTAIRICSAITLSVVLRIAR
jgi:hypothetical protein